MKRRAGFTLIELLVVLAVVAVALAIAVPLLQSYRSRSRVAACKANTTLIGKGLAIYSANFKDQFPWIVSNNRWSARTGASQTAEPNTDVNYNVSALLFMLLHDGAGGGEFFNCPSTADTPDPHTMNYNARCGWNWDFSPYKVGKAEHISYSYQAPMRDANGTWGSGVTAKSNPGLVILADRTPSYDNQNALFNWADPGQADPRTGMSQNHKGESINMLYADLHVGESVGRADAGINNDNIYSCADSEPDANGVPQPATEQGSGSLDLANHISPTDSFLIGPKKMDK
jgi:prepilin-type N-terminal cleavage/methylation domain-containing protein